MNKLYLLDYVILGILCIIILAFIVIYFVRKNHVGDIILRAKPYKFRFFYLFVGLFMLTLGFFNLHSAKFKNNPHLDLIICLSPLFIGILYLVEFLTSKIFIGTKGISFQTIPFYLPLNQITSYEFVKNQLILTRNQNKKYNILIDANEISKLDTLLKKLFKL